MPGWKSDFTDKVQKIKLYSSKEEASKYINANVKNFELPENDLIAVSVHFTFDI